jgi:phosphate transport system substrate-binding protein
MAHRAAGKMRRVACGLCLAAALLVPVAWPGSARALEPLRIAGTGSVTAVMHALADAFMADEPSGVPAPEILTGLGSSGGIEAVLDRAVEMAVSSRRLEASELSRGAHETACAVTPFALVTSNPVPQALKRREVAALYAAPKPHWPDGSLLKIILRSSVDLDDAYAEAVFPGIEAAMAAARQRPDVPLAATDQDNLDLARRIAGSLTGTSLTQLVGEHTSDLHPIALDGVAPSLAAVADGSYAAAVTVCVVLPAKPVTRAQRFVAFMKTPRARRILMEAALMPVQRSAALHGADGPR